MIQSDDITEQLNDGGLGTNGLLHYDPSTARIVYSYFHCNQFVIIDTNLNILYRGTTIDTNRAIKTRVAKVASPIVGRYTYTYAGPPHYVSKTSCVSNGRLYIHSALEADNELHQRFTEESVIDVYDMANGAYRGSFYLPAYEGHRAKEFKISYDTLIALYDGRITTYKIPRAKL